ncbi:hypothetical protein D3C81_1613850 [compost metagenome]
MYEAHRFAVGVGVAQPHDDRIDASAGQREGSAEPLDICAEVIDNLVQVRHRIVDSLKQQMGQYRVGRQERHQRVNCEFSIERL